MSSHTPEPPAELQYREVTDARMLRALAHPVRIALLETLSFTGPLTATELGERIGESPTTCSFHLRQLAKYEFVEEAGGGKGRARPWRLTWTGLRITGDRGDTESQVASSALGRMVRERQLDRYRTWAETRASYPAQWREAADESQYTLYLTPGELKQLHEDMRAMIKLRFRDRITDPSPATRPAGSAPVEMLFVSYPLELPPGDGDDPAGEAS
jgi:DNA-binding transcriptional ArsR family regulator